MGGRPIGRTPDSGSGYPGSSPGLPAKSFQWVSSDARSEHALNSCKLSPKCLHSFRRDTLRASWPRLGDHALRRCCSLQTRPESCAQRSPLPRAQEQARTRLRMPDRRRSWKIKPRYSRGRVRRLAFLHPLQLLPGLIDALQPRRVKMPRPARAQAEFHALRKVAIGSPAFMNTNSLLGLRARSTRSISKSSSGMGIVRGSSFFVEPGSRRISAHPVQVKPSQPKNFAKPHSGVVPDCQHGPEMLRQFLA